LGDIPLVDKGFDDATSIITLADADVRKSGMA
jgi:hypothetical protein